MPNTSHQNTCAVHSVGVGDGGHGKAWISLPVPAMIHHGQLSRMVEAPFCSWKTFLHPLCSGRHNQAEAAPETKLEGRALALLLSMVPGAADIWWH